MPKAPIKVVLDTNILISATIVKQGHPGQILQAWQRGVIEVIVSPQILDEVKDVLSKPRIRKHQWMSEQEVKCLIDSLEQAATKVKGVLVLKVIKEDPGDDKFLVAAKEGAAQYIISGDTHLLKLKSFEGVQIVNPRHFLEAVLKAN